MKNAKPVGSYDKHICLKNELLISCTYKLDCAKKDTVFFYIKFYSELSLLYV